MPPLRQIASPWAPTCCHERLHPADRAAGHEDDRDAAGPRRRSAPPGAVGDRAVGVQQGAVEVGGHEPVHRTEPAGLRTSATSSTATPSSWPVSVTSSAASCTSSGAWPIATPRPAQRSISMSLRPSPIASTSAGRRPSRSPTSASAGRLGDPLGRDVEPGGPADEVVDAVQPELLGEREELLLRGVRVADDHAGHRLGDQLLDATAACISPVISPSGNGRLTR